MKNEPLCKRQRKIIRKSYLHCLKLLISILSFYLSTLDVYCDAAIVIWPYEIKFNYNTSASADDAINLAKNLNDTIEAPEFKYYVSNRAFAYIVGQSNRKIRIRFDSNCPNMKNLLINMRIENGDGFGEIYNISIAFYNRLNEIELNLSGNVPTSINKRFITLRWTIYAEPNCPGYSKGTTSRLTQHTYYTVFAEPQAPINWAWTEVLDYDYIWAGGTTTIENAVTDITDALNNSGFYYTPGTNFGGNSFFTLSTFLSRLPDADDYFVNCLDMAHAVVTFSNALGCSLSVKKYNAAFNRISVNYIDPIGGWPATNNIFEQPYIHNDCRTGGFSFHAFAERDGMIWDATLHYDTDDNPDNVISSNPNCGNTTTEYEWELPCNVNETTYISRLVDSWIYPTDEEYPIECNEPEDCGDFQYINDFYLL